MTERERSEWLAERRRLRDAMRASLGPVARLAEQLVRETLGHPVGGGEPIKLCVLRGPAETDRGRTLPRAIEMEAHTGATLRFTCPDGATALVVEQDLRDGRMRDRRVFQSIDATRTHGENPPYMLQPGRRPVSIPAVLLHFEEIATM